MNNHKIAQVSLNEMAEKCMAQLNKEVFIDKKTGVIEIHAKRNLVVNGQRFVIECHIRFENKGDSSELDLF